MQKGSKKKGSITDILKFIIFKTMSMEPGMVTRVFNLDVH